MKSNNLIVSGTSLFGLAFIVVVVLPTRVACANPTPAIISIGLTDDDLDKVAQRIQQLVITTINDGSIHVTVQPVPGKKFKALLIGEMKTQSDIDSVYAHIEDVLEQAGYTTASLIKSITVAKPTAAAAPSKTVKWLWPMSYIIGNTKIDGTIQLQGIESALNAMYPAKKDAPPSAKLENANLWLYGDKSDVQKMRAFLALIDAPAPQVQMQMWAIQYAGSENGVAMRIKRLHEDIATTQQYVQIAQFQLGVATRINSIDLSGKFFDSLNEAGFAPDVKQDISLLENLILLGLSRKRDKILNDWKANIVRQDPTFQTNMRDRAQYDKNKVLPNLTKLLAKPTTDELNEQIDADQATVTDFVNRVTNYRTFVSTLGLYTGSSTTDPDDGMRDNALAPEYLAKSSLAVNRLLENVLNAFAADMQLMYFQPLLERAQKGYGNDQHGVNLAGQVRVVVTNRRDASVKPDIITYGEKLVPKTLGQDFFNGSTKGIDKNAAGLDALLASVTPLEYALVKAALQPQFSDAFYKIAPGIGVNITPSMTPDGTSADLNIDANFGVDTVVEPGTSENSAAYRPPDAVKNHAVKTISNVSAFDLFEVSSFNTSTMYPKPPAIIPILGNLPLIGNIFRVPRGASKTYHESVILISATVVPRSLGLFGFYGPGGSGKVEKPSSQTVGPKAEPTKP